MRPPAEKKQLKEQMRLSRYLPYMPRSIPDGKILVHNRVKPVSPIGRNGFRIWLQPPSDEPRLIVCNCGWAPHLEKHYRYIVVGSDEDKALKCDLNDEWVERNISDSRKNGGE